MPLPTAIHAQVSLMLASLLLWSEQGVSKVAAWVPVQIAWWLTVEGAPKLEVTLRLGFSDSGRGGSTACYARSFVLGAG